MYKIGLITLTFFCSFLTVFALIMVIFMIVILTCAKPKQKTEITMRKKRNDYTDRKVNDFIRSVLIEDDGQYELLATTVPEFRNHNHIGFEIPPKSMNEEHQYDYAFVNTFRNGKQ